MCSSDPSIQTRIGSKRVVIAFADDVKFDSRVQDIKVALQILLGENGARDIGLQVQRQKCGLGPREEEASLSVKLNIQH